MAKEEQNYIWRDRKRTIFGLPLSFTVYKLTETKLITTIGFLSIKEDEIDLYKVVDKKLELPFWQRVFGCGTIKLSAKDVDSATKEIKSIKIPRKVMDLLDKQILVERDKYRTRGRDMMGTLDNMDNGLM